MNKERGFDPRALDLPLLCRTGESLQGRWPTAAMPRLADSLSAACDTSAAWEARGERAAVAGGEAELWLQLSATADVILQCQRCLQPLVERLVVDRRFRFVRGEDEAARLDEELEEDVLVLQPRLDLHVLLEDELLLALPLVPRHSVCLQPLPLPPAPAEAGEGASDARAHPFAALADLRGRTEGHGGGDRGEL